MVILNTNKRMFHVTTTANKEKKKKRIPFIYVNYLYKFQIIDSLSESKE